MEVYLLFLFEFDCIWLILEWLFEIVFLDFVGSSECIILMEVFMGKGLLLGKIGM